MKNLCSYLFLNKIYCSTDITSTFNIEDLLLPSVSTLAVFSLTCIVSILVYNNFMYVPKELNTHKELGNIVNIRCNEYLNVLNGVESDLVDQICSVEEVISDEISKTNINLNISMEDITLETLKLAKKQIFLERSIIYNYKGINRYLTDFDKNNLPFIKTEDINNNVCDRLIEIEAYLNVSKSIRNTNKEFNKDYMFFFKHQNIIAQKTDKKIEIHNIFKGSFIEEAQYYMLQYKGEAVSFVIEKGIFLV